MKQFQRLTGYFTLFILVLALGLSNAQTQPTFRIGVLDEPSGPLAAGAALAINQINAAGGVQGADGQKYHLVAVTQGPDVFGSLTTAISNLTNASVIAVIGPLTNTLVSDNLAALQAMDVPLITPALSDTLLASETSELLFRSRAQERLLGQALAEVLVKDFSISDIQTIVLDASGTGGQVGFALAARNIGHQLGAAIIFDSNAETIAQLVTRVLRTSPQALVLYGEPALANEFYLGLKNARYNGIIAYDGAESAAFRTGLANDQLENLIAPQTWSYSLTDEASTQFLLNFIHATGRVPQSLEAAGYDSVLLIAAALQRPDTLQNALFALSSVQGAQGVLAPSRLPTGETNDNTVVVQYLPDGGSHVLARFANGIRVQTQNDDESRPPAVIVTPTPRATSTPIPTATPDGVYGKVLSQVLNVRTGPSTGYESVGQLRNAEQVRLVGTSIDAQWGVISFRGLQGWISLASNLVEVTGDLRTLPVVAAPPTPTPGPTSTPAPTATLSTADIVVVGASPSTLTRNMLNNVSVSVQNGGGVTSGQFAIGASFEPGAVIVGSTYPNPGLTPGQTVIITLPVNLTGPTGFYSTVIVADLNSEVNEGPGEANNASFTFNYKLDQAVASSGQITLFSGSSGINLDSTGGDDLLFNAGALSAPGVCVANVASCIGLLTVGLNYDTAHNDAISSANGINTNVVGASFGQTIGFITDGGRRGVLRVDAVSGTSITFSYRVYLP